MRSKKIASYAALVAGVAWLSKVVLVWRSDGGNTDGGLVEVCYVLGVIALGVALLAGGYATVVGAPAWLRVVVPLAVLLLGWGLFGSLDSAAKGISSDDGGLGDELGILISAVIALVAGGVGLARANVPAPAAQPHGGHRAHG